VVPGGGGALHCCNTASANALAVASPCLLVMLSCSALLPSRQYASTKEALQARAQGPGAPLKKFHNDIKRQLINRCACV